MSVQLPQSVSSSLSPNFMSTSPFSTSGSCNSCMCFSFSLIFNLYFIMFIYTEREEWASLVAQLVNNLPAMQETRIRSLGPEYPLEKKTAAHSSIFPWEIPWAEEPSRLQFMGT